MRCPANIVIVDDNDRETECCGNYYGDGRITCVYSNIVLMVDPTSYYSKDSKRMFSKYGWTEYRIKSVMLVIPKTSKNTG